MPARNPKEVFVTMLIAEWEGAERTTFSGRLLDVFVEDFRRELAEIQSPEGQASVRLGQA
jgi:hypothetical protein